MLPSGCGRLQHIVSWSAEVLLYRHACTFDYPITVLEVGVRKGDLLEFCRGMGMTKYIGMGEESEIDAANARAKQEQSTTSYEWVAANPIDHALPTSCADVVCSFGKVFHEACESRATLARLLCNISNALKPGGRLIGCMFDPSGIVMSLRGAKKGRKVPLGSALLDAPDKGIEWPKGDSASFFVSFGSGDKTEQYHLVNVQLLIRMAREFHLEFMGAHDVKSFWEENSGPFEEWYQKKGGARPEKKHLQFLEFVHLYSFQRLPEVM